MFCHTFTITLTSVETLIDKSLSDFHDMIPRPAASFGSLPYLQARVPGAVHIHFDCSPLCRSIWLLEDVWTQDSGAGEAGD